MSLSLLLPSSLSSSFSLCHRCRHHFRYVIVVVIIAIFLTVIPIIVFIIRHYVIVVVIILIIIILSLLHRYPYRCRFCGLVFDIVVRIVTVIIIVVDSDVI